jgi:hypothetical protein
MSRLDLGIENELLLPGTGKRSDDQILGLSGVWSRLF